MLPCRSFDDGMPMVGEFGAKVDTDRINLAETADFDLGGLRVCPAHREVRMNGERRELEPRVAQVLIALASARPEVVSRDRLIEQCWDGRIVGDDALNRCIVALRHLAKEFSPQPFEIETVPRVGYSLVERPDIAAARGAGKFRTKIAFAALLILLVAAGLAFGWSRFGRDEATPASIAVLPFRNLSGGDPYFAEGVGEEIMGQLAREPAFQVAGSASAARFRGPSNPREVGRALGVDYILEGSVRSNGGLVRINASLLNASDGTRVWSETYDRKLDDVFEIQTAIGQAVANGLSRRLIHSEGKRPVNGEAYALYLNARGILRSGVAGGGQDAIGLLREAIRIDPGYAPAWSSLAQAWLLEGRTKDNEGMIAVVPLARDAARRSLQLDRNLGEAHAVFSDFLGSDSPQAIAERMRAGTLAARTGEGQLWRAAALEASGRWEEALVAMHQAHNLDQSWSQPWRALLDATALMGDRPGAEAAIYGGFASDPMLQSFARARLAWFTGDFSDAARRWSVLANSQSQWAGPSRLSLENALFSLNLSKHPPSRPPRPTVGQARSTPARVWMKTPPSPEDWQKRNRSSAAELVYRDENVIAAKLMLNGGRAKELVATYESPTGLLGVRRGQPIGTCFLQSAAIISVALRAAGRAEEADAILRQTDEVIRAAYQRGRVPLWFEDDAAGIWALQGKPEMAIAALDRAYRRGSAHATRTDLPKLEDEPAFRSLRAHPRFEAVRSKYEAHYARERKETARALKISIPD
jgi:TolB-like protein/DNA-binding winged helix-turn-helix (wHTH) protein